MAVGYGIDTWCEDSQITGRFARGKRVVMQALYRRLITPRGTLRGGPDEAAYGFDLAGYLGSTRIDTVIRALPGLIRAELLKDDRVADVSARVVDSADAAGRVTLTVEIHAILVNENEDFRFTLSVDDVTVSLLGYEP